MTPGKHSRREFMRSLAIGTGAALLPSSLSACRTVGQELAPAASGDRASQSAARGWQMVPEILARIKPPVFPDRDFDIAHYGAVGDGAMDCTLAFRNAIAACAATGGGRVVVPPGRFLTGAVHLRSNVNLHVTKGATVAFSRDPAKYLPQVLTRFEGTELMNYSPFIYALDQENIGITGEGTLDGQANHEYWWPWKGTASYGWTPGAPNYNLARNRLLAMAEGGVPVTQRVFGDGDYLRPQFIQPYRCRNVLIEDITVVNSPMWEIHPVLCSNVTIRRVRIDSHGPNNDGCDPESCRDVLIDECVFNTGDDCIAIKSGRNGDGRRVHVPSENIVIRGCHMVDGHGGVTLGSEISGGCRYVFVEGCRMDSPRLDMAIRLKNNASRGGVLEHIYVRDIVVGQVAQAVLSIDFNYEEGSKGGYKPVARDVEIRNVTSGKSAYALYLRGFVNAPITDIRVIDCTFAGVGHPNMIEHVNGLTLDHVTINGKLIQS